MIRYSDKEKKEAVKAWEMNGKDFSKTCEETGVSKRALQNWVKQFPEVLTTAEELTTRAVRKKADVRVRDFVDRVVDVKSAALKRLEELVPNSESIPDILKAIDTMHSLEKEINGEQSDILSQNVIFYQQITQQLVES